MTGESLLLPGKLSTSLRLGYREFSERFFIMQIFMFAVSIKQINFHFGTILFIFFYFKCSENDRIFAQLMKNPEILKLYRNKNCVTAVPQRVTEGPINE